MTYMGKPYYPLWLDNLADDVTGEGPAWDGAIEGAQAVHEVVVAAREIYEFQDFHYAGPCAENSFLEDYSSSVRGVPSARHRVGHLQRRRQDSAARRQSSATQRGAGIVPRDARKVRRHTARQTLGRHTLRTGHEHSVVLDHRGGRRQR